MRQDPVLSEVTLAAPRVPLQTTSNHEVWQRNSRYVHAIACCFTPPSSSPNRLLKDRAIAGWEHAYMNYKSKPNANASRRLLPPYWTLDLKKIINTLEALRQDPRSNGSPKSLDVFAACSSLSAISADIFLGVSRWMTIQSSTGMLRRSFSSSCIVSWLR